ncbi:MAG: SDR family NAD(P)-dependent oxidoreductase [Halobacteriales archaeon]
MLRDKTAVVTGGSSGIGRAIAEKYVEQGAEVTITGRNAERGRETAEDIGCTFRECDVRDYDSVEHVVDETAEDSGLDVVVNNAGIGTQGSVEEMSLDEWRDTLDTNLDGVMHGVRASIPWLVEDGGSIVNVASIYGLRGGVGAAAYSASKGGVVNLTRQVAVDYATEDVRANAICPGFVRTPMTEEALDDDEFYEFVRRRTPMDRAAEPEEIAPLAAFLASDGSSYLTGAAIPVDGGWTCF